MAKETPPMIDALFGSRTRVKLLHLFFNNAGRSFYVREITRLIDEQINSVRRELSNMLGVGVILSNSADNKLFYEVNQSYEYYTPLRQIFSDTFHDKTSRNSKPTPNSGEQEGWKGRIAGINGVSVVIAAGKLVHGSGSNVDLLIVGSRSASLMRVIKDIESAGVRDLAYSIMNYDDFYYRLSVRDRFVLDMLSNRHEVIVDTNSVL